MDFNLTGQFYQSELTDRENINIMSSVISIQKAGKIKSVCWFRAQLQASLFLVHHLRSIIRNGPKILVLENGVEKSQIQLSPMDFLKGVYLFELVL